jgi:hypothetical protein
MMETRRKIKRELKEEAMVTAYFERKLGEMKISDLFEEETIVKTYFDSLKAMQVTDSSGNRVEDIKPDVAEAYLIKEINI